MGMQLPLAIREEDVQVHLYFVGFLIELVGLLADMMLRDTGVEALFDVLDLGLEVCALFEG